MVCKLCWLPVVAVVCVLTGDHAVKPIRAVDKETKTAGKSPYVHAVVFHLKKDAPSDAAEMMIKDSHELLAKIPSVRELRVGRPAEKDSADFVKKDYQVGLVIFFDDHAGLMEYVEHPLHKKYVERNIKNIDTDKLAVFDFMNQLK